MKEIKSMVKINKYQKELIKKMLNEMFISGEKTFIGIANGTFRKTLSVGYIINHLNDILGKKSVYFTGNILKPNRNRMQANVAILNDIYLDLDTNHGETMYATPVDAYYQLIDFIKTNNILRPSMIINTTRGLQLHWFIEPIMVTPERIKLWQRIEKALSRQFREFYSDETVATDYSRLLRFPLTINAVTGTLSEILEMDGERYSLESIKGNVLKCGFEASTQAQRDYIKAIEEKLGKKFPDSYKETKKNAITTIKLNKHILNKPSKEEADLKGDVVTEKQLKYITDICKRLNVDIPDEIATYSDANCFIRNHMEAFKRSKKANKKKCTFDPVLELRNLKAMEMYVLKHPVNDHCRENLLFLYRLAALHVYDNEKIAWEKTCKLNRQYDAPFSERKLDRLTYSAVKYHQNQKERWYGPNAINSKVIGNNDVESMLPYFTRLKTEKRNLQNYNKEYYERKLNENGKEKKQAEIDKRRLKVRELRQYGYTYQEIAKKLNVSVKTIQRDICAEKTHTAKKQDKNSITYLLNNTIGIPARGKKSLQKAPIPLTKASGIKEDTKKQDRRIVYQIEVVQAYKKIQRIAETEFYKTQKDYSREMRLFDELLYVFEKVDVNEIMQNKNTEIAGIIGKTIVFLSRENRNTICKILDHIKMEYNISQDIFKAKHNFIMSIKEIKKLESIEEYYKNPRTRTIAQIKNIIRVSRARRSINSIINLTNDTKDFYIKRAISKFFYWRKTLKASNGNETIKINGIDYSKSELAKNMFFEISVKKIYEVADMLKKNATDQDIIIKLAGI